MAFPPLPLSVEIENQSSLCDVDSYEAPDILESQKRNPISNIPLYGYDYPPGLDIDVSEASVDIDSQVFGRNTDQYDDEDEIGSWPRRLLHVPSMTSFEWAPGNNYGDCVAPRYNAISYTWGRYDLDRPGLKKKKAYRNTKAIEIKGIKWGTPRINPQHFTVDEFEHLIKQTCVRHSGTDRDVEFLWLDVACIDQNNGPQKMAEIGRQAAIFQGAHRVFVWLSKHSENRLSCIIEDLIHCSKMANVSTEISNPDLDLSSRLMTWLASARASLDKLLIDPWFSSLWTLQEAFLCQHAYLVPLEATLIPTVNDPSSEVSYYVSLEGLWNICGSLSKACATERLIVDPLCEANEAASKIDDDLLRWLKYLRDVEGMMNVRGFIALAGRNPIELYRVAQYRPTRHDQDRVYGIQQVFGFRLGATAPGRSSSKRNPYNRYVLENQLGSAILMKYPVASQLHVFSGPVEEGRGWRISPSSRVPRLDIKSSIWDLEYEPHCELSTKFQAFRHWGTFRGRVCDFNLLAKAWIEISRRWNSSPTESPQQIALDVTQLSPVKLIEGNPTIPNIESEPIWKSIISPKSGDVARGEQQHRLAWWIQGFVKKFFGDGELVVLLLGNFVDDAHIGGAREIAHRYNVGLIMIRRTLEGQYYWKRLGFCIWQLESQHISSDETYSQESIILRADETCDAWNYIQDLFG